MKPVQVVFDEKLLEQLDACEEVQRLGRSAVLRRAVSEYLRRRQRREIAAAYARAYGSAAGLGEEFADWEDQGQWPEE